MSLTPTAPTPASRICCWKRENDDVQQWRVQMIHSMFYNQSSINSQSGFKQSIIDSWPERCVYQCVCAAAGQVVCVCVSGFCTSHIQFDFWLKHIFPAQAALPSQHRATEHRFLSLHSQTLYKDRYNNSFTRKGRGRTSSANVHQK